MVLYNFMVNCKHTNRHIYIYHVYLFIYIYIYSNRRVARICTKKIMCALKLKIGVVYILPNLDNVPFFINK